MVEQLWEWHCLGLVSVVSLTGSRSDKDWVYGFPQSPVEFLQVFCFDRATVSLCV